jgi:hypothetical protein
MVSKIGAISFDCHDTYKLASFWSEVTGFGEFPGYPLDPERDDNGIQAPDGAVSLVFLKVPEGKTVKNRVHLDLRPEILRDQEVERLLGIGATLVADHRKGDGTGWVVLADPEGNEFCIERSEAERVE